MSDFYDQDVVVVAHVDLDGMCASACVKKKYPNARVFYSNYGRDTPSPAFIRGCKMFVVDFSLSEIEMQKCRNLGIDLIWIDHHENNYRALEQKGFSFPGIRRADASGTELTWKFLFPNAPVPSIVNYVTDYDLWRFRLPDTKKVQCGLGMFETRCNYRSCKIWETLLSDDRSAATSMLGIIINIGDAILKYSTNRNKLICDDLAYTTQWNGKKIVVANTKQANSTFFDSYDKTGLDAVAMLQYSPDVCKFRGSFYSPDDVKEVLAYAKLLGGGGHPKACGFQSASFPFTPPDPTTPPPLDKVIGEYHKMLMVRNNVIVNQYATRNDSIYLRANTFKTMFLNGAVMAMNHPYLSELIRGFPSVVNLVDDNGDILKLLLSFVQTKYGCWRNACYFTNVENADNSKEAVLKPIQKQFPDVTDVYTEDLGCLGKVYHWYSQRRPVSLPDYR